MVGWCPCFPSRKAQEEEVEGDDVVGDDGRGSQPPSHGHEEVEEEQPLKPDGEAGEWDEVGAARHALGKFVGLSNKDIEDEGMKHLLALSDTPFVAGQRAKLTTHTDMGSGIPECPVECSSALRGPSDLVARMAPLPVPQIARNIARCIDAVLYPIIERSIERKDRPGEFTALLQLCKDAVVDESRKQRGGNYNRHPQTAMCLGIRAGLLALGWISGAIPLNLISPSGSPIPPSCCVVSSVCTCVNVIDGTLCNPRQGVESLPAVVDGVKHLVSFLGILGVLLGMPVLQTVHEGNTLSWLRHLPFYVLDPATKGTLLYLSAFLGGQARLSLPQLPRTGVLDAMVRYTKANGVFGRNATGTVRFAHEPDEVHCGDAFDLIAAEITSPWGPEYYPSCSATLQEGSSHVLISYRTDLDAHCCAHSNTSSSSSSSSSSNPLPHPLRPSCRLIFRGLSQYYHHEHISISDTLELIVNRIDVDPELSKDSCHVYRVRCNKTSPISVPNIAFAVSAPTTPLFTREKGAGGVWFNCSIPELGETPYSGTEHQDLWLERYGFVGWLLGHAIANRVPFPVGLPPLFFAMLKEWYSYHPTEAHLMSLSGTYQRTALDTVRGMSADDFKNVLELQNLPPSTTVDEYIAHIAKEVLVSQIQAQMASLVCSFHNTDVGGTAFRYTTPHELCTIICGRNDDGVSDSFNLRYEFKVVVDPDPPKYLHTDTLLSAFWDVVDSGIDDGRRYSASSLYPLPPSHANLGNPLAPPSDPLVPDALLQVPAMKRRFLRFVTGRSLLPCLPQHEVLHVVISDCGACTASEYDQLLARFPTSRTCDNTLTIPDYAEAVIFSSESKWYKEGRPVGTTITDTDKEAAWKELCDEKPGRESELRKSIETVLRHRLSTAIASSDGLFPAD